MNWTAVTKRLSGPDREMSRTALADEQPTPPSRTDGEGPVQGSTPYHGLDPEPAAVLRRASSVRAFTPHDAYAPRHRADRATDWVGDRTPPVEHATTQAARTG